MRGRDAPHRWLAVAVTLLLTTGGAVVAVRSGPAPAGAVEVVAADALVTKDGVSPPRAEPRAAPSPTMSATPTPTPTPTSTPALPPPTPAPTTASTPPTTPTPTAEPPPIEPAEQPGTDVPEGPSERTVHATGHAPFGGVAGITLHHPADRVERIGLHQSNHEGARDVEVYATAAAPLVLESRDRLSGPQSASDIVVDPTAPILAPVSGTVVRAGTYNLYCDLYDEFAVIAPDAQPAWEVKLLHIVGLRVVAGQRVEAGVTPLADHAHTLPFESQVDEWTAEPSWPHVHLEVVDPSIPNQPNGGSGYEDC